MSLVCRSETHRGPEAIEWALDSAAHLARCGAPIAYTADEIVDACDRVERLWRARATITIDQRDSILEALIRAEVALPEPLARAGCPVPVFMCATTAFGRLVIMLADTPEQRAARPYDRRADAVDTVRILRNAMHNVALVRLITDRARARRQTTIQELWGLSHAGIQEAQQCRD